MTSCRFIAGLHRTTEMLDWGSATIEIKGEPVTLPAILTHNRIYGQTWAWVFNLKSKKVENVSPSLFKAGGAQ